MFDTLCICLQYCKTVEQVLSLMRTAERELENFPYSLFVIEANYRLRQLAPQTVGEAVKS